MKKKKTQAERILDILQKGDTVSSFDGRIDGREAYGILDVPKRISELRQKGHSEIKDRLLTVINRHGEKCTVKQYWIPQDNRTPQKRQAEKNREERLRLMKPNIVWKLRKGGCNSLKDIEMAKALGNTKELKFAIQMKNAGMLTEGDLQL